MNMLNSTSARCDGIAHKDVVDLLSMLIVGVRIPLFPRHTDDLVDIVQEHSEGAEDHARRQVFVHISRDDDACGWGMGEDGVDESL